MKTIEEKARAYDEAIKRAKEWEGNPAAIDYIFPELKNKDENIKNKLINLIKMSSEFGGLALHKWEADEMLAWLERQVDYANFRDKAQVGDRITKNEDGVLVNLSQLKRVAKLNEKQGEQKPADSYCQENCKGFQETGKCFADGECNAKKEAEQKPTSEEDEPQKELAKSYLAKFDEKFPILPTLKGKRLADYKNFLNKCQQIFGLKYWGLRSRQAKLFEKLSLLWAAWGAEHLQGLGQADGDMDDEILWSDEDERLCQCLIEDQEEALDKVSNNKYGHSEIISDLKEMYHERIDWLKSLKPQNRWKPSDEQICLLQAIINEPNNAASESCQIVLKDILEQLKKLKEEV